MYGRQGAGDGEHADYEGKQSGGHRPEGEEQHDRRRHESPQLSPPGVLGAQGEDVPLQGGLAGDVNLVLCGRRMDRCRPANGGTKGGDRSSRRIGMLGIDRGQQECRAPAGPDEVRPPVGEVGEDPIDIRLADRRRGQSFDQRSERRAVHRNGAGNGHRHELRDGPRERPADHRPSFLGFGGAGGAASHREHLSHAGGSGHGKPGDDDPADDEGEAKTDYRRRRAPGKSALRPRTLPRPAHH